MSLGAFSKWVVTVRFDSGRTASSTGSDRTRPEGGTTTFDFPPNVSRSQLRTAIRLSPALGATLASPIVSGPFPYSFENAIRIFEPPTDIRTICRNVLPASPGSGGKLPGSVNCCAETQVVAQCGFELPIAPAVYADLELDEVTSGGAVGRLCQLGQPPANSLYFCSIGPVAAGNTGQTVARGGQNCDPSFMGRVATPRPTKERSVVRATFTNVNPCQFSVPP